MSTIHMRGFKKVYMVTILEGNGKDEPYREVKYFYDDDTDIFIGKLDPIQSNGDNTNE